jgi:L-alanine-DL-glutamate epimerase-like enolase superfamily enzyme
MKRREFMTSLLSYNALLLDARAQGTSRAPKLKIREIRAVRLRGTVTKYVRVYTEQGLYGTGEMVDTVGADEIVNNNLGPGLAGRDPLDIEAIYWDYWSWKAPPGGIPAAFMHGMGGPYLTAMSGIDIALWDLAGKALGLPVYRLLGGRVRNRLRVYHHANDPKQARELMARTGVSALKTSVDAVIDADNSTKGWDPGKRYGFALTNGQIDDVVQHVSNMREAVGQSGGLALECHSRFDVESAIQLAKAVERFRPMWLEEPVNPDNVDAMARVRSLTRIPIAAGENIYTRYGFRPFLEKQALSIIQPDMCKCGGLLEARKIAAMAETYHIPLAPHGVASSLGKTAFGHVCATVPNFMILEWAQGHAAQDKLTSAPNLKNGFLELTDAPGIGIELNMDAVKEAQDGGRSL